MDDRRLGDYRLHDLLDEHGGVRLWRAEQVSVARPVVVAEWTRPEGREGFLAAIRAKASVDHPLIGSIYEAIDEPEHCFAAFERLPGRTLADRLAAREKLPPVELAVILRRLAEAMIHLRERRIASEPLTPGHVHLDENGVLRLENTAEPGETDPEGPAADIARFGASLPGLVAEGRPGASRVLTVLAWMRGQGISEPLSWEQVRGYGEQIESQLLEAGPGTGPKTRHGRRAKRRTGVIVALVGALVLAGVALVALRGDETPSEEPEEPRRELVAVPAGSHPTPDGDEENLAAFRISPTEVTIGEYLAFLDTLGQLEPADREFFDLENQPESKTGHEPDDWSAMLAAAREGGTWQGRRIDLRCPITNIDWWDAAAYAEWKGARLPTQEEWFAALRHRVNKPEGMQPAGWGPVDDAPITDRTPNGLLGMAGSVSEWTRRPATNPANPLGRKQFVIVGASWNQPAGGALARRWTSDRLERRPDLGFRLVHPAGNDP